MTISNAIKRETEIPGKGTSVSNCSMSTTAQLLSNTVYFYAGSFDFPFDPKPRDESAHLADGGAAEDVGSSRVDLQACKLEYSIVSPK